MGTTDRDSKSMLELIRSMGLCSEDEAPNVSMLGGGVSNVVARVEAEGGTWVVKQALPRLRVLDEWVADRARIFSETACLKLIRETVRGHPAPAVLSEDKANYACVLEYAGDGTRTWKRDLLGGHIDRNVTRQVAAILSEFHSKTRGKDNLRIQFGGGSNFSQLRLDPYLATVVRRHPFIGPQIDEITSFLSERKICVVHGDFSPKNILLLPDGRIWVIDCEVAHYGNPAFDIAFCVNHIVLKAVHLGSLPHMEEARALWSSYWAGSGFANLQGEAVRTLAALLLARIDGKSPVEYLTELERDRMRSIALSLIMEREESFAGLIEKVSESAGIGSAE